jgi:hypothetical protein
MAAKAIPRPWSRRAASCPCRRNVLFVGAEDYFYPYPSALSYTATRVHALDRRAFRLRFTELSPALTPRSHYFRRRAPFRLIFQRVK